MSDLAEQQPTNDASITEEAGVWLARMESNKYDRQEFLRWLRASPSHVHKILDVMIWHQLIEMSLVPAASRGQNGAGVQACDNDIYRRVLQRLNS